jgi:putative ABC transport system permease protein
VGNVKHFSLEDPATPTYYAPIAQVSQPAVGFLINGLSAVVRTASAAAISPDSLRSEIQALDPDVAASSGQTMDQALAGVVAPRLFNLVIIQIFAGDALVLAAMGLYSVIAYSVAQRRHEIGIRMALGASAADVFREVLRDGLVLIAIGLAAGLSMALLATRLITGLLFGVAPTDPLTFGAVTLILAGIALIACYVPAKGAVSVDPSTALRNG